MAKSGTQNKISDDTLREHCLAILSNSSTASSRCTWRECLQDCAVSTCKTWFSMSSSGLPMTRPCASGTQQRCRHSNLLRARLCSLSRANELRGMHCADLPLTGPRPRMILGSPPSCFRTCFRKWTKGTQVRPMLGAVSGPTLIHSGEEAPCWSPSCMTQPCVRFSISPCQEPISDKTSPCLRRVRGPSAVQPGRLHHTCQFSLLQLFAERCLRQLLARSLQRGVPSMRARQRRDRRPNELTLARTTGPTALGGGRRARRRLGRGTAQGTTLLDGRLNGGRRSHHMALGQGTLLWKSIRRNMRRVQQMWLPPLDKGEPRPPGGATARGTTLLAGRLTGGSPARLPTRRSVRMASPWLQKLPPPPWSSRLRSGIHLCPLGTLFSFAYRMGKAYHNCERG